MMNTQSECSRFVSMIPAALPTALDETLLRATELVWEMEAWGDA